MTAQLENIMLDYGLRQMSSAQVLSICANANEPTTYALASTTALLGFVNLGSSGIWQVANLGSPANGRSIASVTITTGTITTTGTAGWWACYDSSGGSGTLYAHGTLQATQAVTSGNTFSLSAFTITIPAH
jgi:hypothetical protein